MIFDAPTSSFESLKEDEFYNVIDKIKKQCIIVTKDLLEKDDVTGERRLNLEKSIVLPVLYIVSRSSVLSILKIFLLSVQPQNRLSDYGREINRYMGAEKSGIRGSL